MQIIAYREETRLTHTLKADTSKILHFSLLGVLPSDYTLALNLTLGTLSCLAVTDSQPCLIMQQQFTNNELSVLRPLLESHPYYCPYEILFASFYNGNLEDQTVEDCRQRLQSALEHGTWEQETRPIRNVLSRVRIKLRIFGINIVSILETGYILKAAPVPSTLAAAN